MPSYDYVGFIKSMLSNGAKLSSEIADALVGKFGIKKTYARKIISRLNKEDIFNSHPLFFSSGQLGYSLSSEHGDYVKLLSNKPRLLAGYNLLNKRKIVSKFDLLKITGALDAQSTKYYDFGRLLFDLRYFFPNLSEQEIDGSILYTIQGVSGYEELLKSQIINAKILPFVLSYCMKIGLISRKPHYVSQEKPFEGIKVRQHLLFDATAFTSIGNPNEEKTICVFDVGLKGYGVEELNGFRYRYETLIHATKKYNQRVIPIIVVDEIDYGVEKQILSSNKVLILKLSNIFGSRIKDFLNAIGLTAIDSIADASDILQIVESSGFANQLTRFFPFVFEQIINEMILKVLGDSFAYSHGKKLHLRNGDTKEFDGWFESTTEILIVESKFHKKNLIKWEDIDSRGNLRDHCLKYFFIEKYRFVQVWKRERNLSKNVKMVFVSANGFYKEVGNHISEIPTDTNHSIFSQMMTASELIKLCGDRNIPSLREHKDWLRKYYIRKSGTADSTESTTDEEVYDIFLDPPSSN